MRTAHHSDALLRRKKYDLIKNSDRCVCGAYKMRGAAFCRTCTNGLPSHIRVGLFRANRMTWPDAYDAASVALGDSFRAAEKAVQNG